MGPNVNPQHLSRRRFFGVGAATTAGIVAGGNATAAFASSSSEDDRLNPSPEGESGFVAGDEHFVNAMTRLPGTELLVFTAGDFHADSSATTLPSTEGVHSVTGGFVEANLRLPVGAIIRRIDVFGEHLGAGTQSWRMQRYDPTAFGASNASALYPLDISGSGNLTGALPIPADGITVAAGIVYAVYLSSSSSTNMAWGVACQYDPPVRTFRPIDPVRVYDSRAAAPTPGVLAPNQSRVVSVKDGRNAAGTVITADVVPVGATAVSFNVTATGTTGPNFLSVQPGGAASAPTSTVNWGGGYDIANGGVVKLDTNRQIKVFMGDQAGSAHVIVDITGYYI